MDIVGIVAAVGTFVLGLVVAKQWFQAALWSSKEAAELLIAAQSALADGKLSAAEIEAILEEANDVKEAVMSFRKKKS